jgi:hypothetical protein
MSSSPIQLDHRIRSALAALRRRIRCYIWIQGVAIIVAVVGVVFWASLAVDWFFEPSVLVRKILLGTSLLAVAATAYRVIGRRAFVPLPDHSMAILLERRFSEFEDSLLTAVELTARPPDPNDCNMPLLEATCRTAAIPLDQVRLREVFNPRPLRAAIIGAVLLATATGLFRSFAPDAFAVWLRRSVLMSHELWPRRTILAVEGFPEGVARVAKGSDFTLIAKADMTARLIPRTVRIDYRPEGSPRLDATMVREGQAEVGRDRYQAYSYTFRAVLSPIDLTLRGGDASIRNLRIELVDPPTLVRLDAECRYPDYMGRLPRTLPVSGVVPIPKGTEVTLQLEANKRLTQVQILSGESTQVVSDPLMRRFLEMNAFLREIARRSRSGDTKETAEDLAEAAIQLEQFEEEVRRRFANSLTTETLRVVLDGIALAQDALQNAQKLSETESFALVQDRFDHLHAIVGTLVGSTHFVYRLQPIEETKALELTLHDIDGIKSTQPIRIVLSAVDDQPPQPIVRLNGIGSAITPQARLPFHGTVTDDHGVERVWLEYAVEGREPRQRTLKQLEEITTQVTIVEAFDVSGLRLEPGQKLLIAVKAQDRYDLAPEPNVGSGDRWMFDVVTPERLRAMLEAREIVLRQRFETIVEDVVEIRGTLAGLSFDEESTTTTSEPAEPTEVAEPGDPKRAETPERRRAVRLLRIQRARQNGQKDTHETAGVSDGFADIRRELINNRIYTEELRIRIEEDIVAPLTGLIKNEFVQLDERLARLETRHDDPTESSDLRDGAVEQTDRILKTMHDVLARMVELEDFNEAVQLLRSIIEEQEQLREAVRERRKAKLRQLLEN